MKERITSIDVYKEAAEKYKPQNIKYLFIAESPPFIKPDQKPRYFYFEEYRGKDFLFKGITEVLFPKEYQNFRESGNKKELLTKLKENGFFLIDACNYPINQHKDRDAFINQDYPKLVQKIKLLANSKTQIILIKRNIYDLLNDPLREEGLTVANTEHLDFPSCGNQLKFKNKFKKLMGK